MKAYLDDRQRHHDPKHFMANGQRLQNPEQPQRLEVLKAGAEATGCLLQPPRTMAQDPSPCCIAPSI